MTTVRQPGRLNKQRLRELASMPMQQLFDAIYKQGYWGISDASLFYSGDGSHADGLTAPYVSAVREFLQSLPQPPTVVDLGCGDFHIGRQFLDLSGKLYACDVVSGLIEHNCQQYAADNLEFICLDATCQTLPEGDVLMVRQVLQHLSNTAIARILPQLKRFTYVIVTEHLPSGSFRANVEKANGPDTRLRYRSGVVLTQTPFNFKPVAEYVLCEVADTNNGGIIRSTLYQT